MKAPNISTLALSLIAGCGACDSEVTSPPVIASQISLTAAASCAELERIIEDAAVEEMRARLSDHWYLPVDMGGPTRAPVMAPEDAQPQSYTKTNTQVRGVDEPDFVKSDGKHLFVLSGERLHIVKSWPAYALSLVGSVSIEGWPQEMFLEAEQRRLAVFSFVPEVGTKLTVIDASDVEQPAIADEVYFPGWYTNARRHDATVRVVLQDNLRWPAELKWWPDYDPALYGDENGLEKALEELKARNEPLIRAQSLEGWLPPAQRRKSDGTMIALPYDCTDFNYTNAPINLGLTSVMTVNLDLPESVPGRTSILAQSGESYASNDYLYITSPHWWWWPEPGQESWTYIFKLDAKSSGESRFLAGGGVAGHPVDQFALDEHRGDLRIATTIERREPAGGDPWGRLITTNRVTVLGPELEEISQTPDIAKDEHLYSARFLGEKGFLVTFRQIDPLFTLDLSDRTKPRVIGELEVPGFSSYIHPLDAAHLLTIGVYIDPLDTSTRRLQLAIYDVSDFTHPVQKHLQLVGTAHGWSDALWEHKAFTYFAERKLLAIPFADWSGADWTGFTSELRVFGVDIEAGFTAKGALSMSDVYGAIGDDRWQASFSPWVRRGSMADDYVYAISDAGVRSAHAESLWSPLATVLFPRGGGTN